jgi:hypothetical protein
MSIATLPFTLERVQDEEGLLEAAAVRSLSYGHHAENLRDRFAVPDEIDFAPDTVVLLCRDKLNRDPVGTARVQSSHRTQLLIDQCVDLPSAMRSEVRAEITRLAARPGADALVRLALWKAVFLVCLSEQVRWMVIGARNEALVRAYRSIGFADIHPDESMVPLPYAGNLPHRILAFNVTTAERSWYERQHRMYGFMFETTHPDIRLLTSRVIRATSQREVAT